MNDLKIKKKIKEEMFKVLEENEKLNQSDDIKDNEKLEFYGFDSLNLINLIIGLEVTFEIEFEDEELLMDKFETVNKIFSLVKEKLEL